MKRTRILTVAIIAVVALLCLGAVGAFAGKTAGDMTPPVTTTEPPSSYEGEDVGFSFHATDASGVAYVYYRIDKSVLDCSTVPTDTVHTEWDVTVTPPIKVAADDPHPEMVPLPIGEHTLKYWSQDNEGNVEAQHVMTFVVNPLVYLGSSATSVKAGKTFTLSGTLEPARRRWRRRWSSRPRPQGPSRTSSLPSSTATPRARTPFKYKTSVKGTWWFRTSFADPATGMTASSIPETVKVK